MPRAHLTTAQRGYDSRHQRTRATYKPAVDAGQWDCQELRCLLPTRWIQPGTPWDLAHDRRAPGQYLGPAHQRCNRAEGIRFRHSRARRRRQTTGWQSRQW